MTMNYRMYSRSHFVKGMELMVLLICYRLYGKATEDSVAYAFVMGSTWFLVDDAKVWRPNSEVKFISDAIGTIVAWPNESTSETFKSQNQTLRILSKRIAPLSPLPEVYLALLALLFRCTSVKRLVADLILRYALYCPTAVGDALQAVIDMHNFSVEALKRGQDTDGVAFQTAKACIFGLVDLCSAAYSKTKHHHQGDRGGR
ncbi:unnamed protein product [Arabidopsis arenosa]|uniref:Uncharacterized protein n=1 Tax=Arabidopsis arenosa TaxID=38785 RepID=A0A8S2ADU6_ARAAE|nr:unnamed protein product [Arabidopsis arenosa]